MVFRYLNHIVMTASVMLAGMAVANDFGPADDIFKQRHTGPVKVQEALAAYAQILRGGNLSEPESVYAVEQQGRLFMYWGYIVDQNNYSLRESIANQCLTTVETIQPQANFAATPQYYYWKAACLMARANARGVTSSLADSQLIADTIDAGKTLAPSYEGGGFDRLAGLLFSKLPVWNPLGPSGDMPRALQHFRRALAADVYDDPMFPNWKDPDTETGEYFYDGYFYYAEALTKDDQVAEARSIIQTALDRITSGDLPVGREAEAQIAKVRLEEFLRTLSKHAL
jgi:tetratricopeptide (TPR) repeat protein